MLKNCYYIFAVLFIGITGCTSDGILNPSEKLTRVPVMDFVLDSEDYTRLLSNKTNGLRVPVRIHFENEMVIGDVRATGGGSRYDPRWSYRVVLSQGTSIDHLTEITLSAQVNDPTMVHTSVVSALYHKIGFPVIENRHVFLRINNVDAGLYVMIEVIKEPFFSRRNLAVNELYKIGFGTDFYLQESNDLFFSVDKEIPADKNYNSLLQFVEALNKSTAGDIQAKLDPFLDVDSYLSYHAMTSLVNNVDAFTNNFYLWRELPISAFKIVPWDFDRSFERSNNVGLYGANAVIEKLLQNPALFETYKNKLSFYLDEVFTINEVFPIIDSTAAFIEEAYLMDPYLGDGRYRFENEIYELKNYIIERIDYFEENLGSLTFGSK